MQMEGEERKRRGWAGCGIHHILFFFFRVSQFNLQIEFFRLPLQERDVGDAPPITPSPGPVSSSRADMT